MEHTMYAVTVLPLGATVAAGASTTLLQALEAAGIELPSSCRNGTCRTCLCRLQSGTVAYTVEWPGLSLEEKRDGDVLPCVALARSDLVLNVPLARRVCTDHR
ncbi:2Fe-2S iron-sulfur cluster-binding protein [Massilia aurea]|uniref:2Fe-2S iron-sulfur cluster-binding protein n=1 Tax=Massilia aurea TaxID=373040 RepID=UPI003461E016